MKKSLALLALLAAAAGPAAPDYQAPRHSPIPSPLLQGAPIDVALRADSGTEIERDRSPADELAEHRKLARALQALAPQRRGVVDAYVVSIALDSDPVFGREARAAGDVLGRRFGAVGRTLVLAGSDGSAPSRLPRGTPATLAVALARIAELIDRKEDVLVLYTTSHGAPFGLYYHDADNGFGAISPARLRAMLNELGLGNRLLILSACYSGVFVPVLQSPSTAIVTAAAADRTSFGCAAQNDWTYFGDAMINHALRKPQPLSAAVAEAIGLVSAWEAKGGISPSWPQFFAGADSFGWLTALEKRMPKTATQPTGRPSVDTTLPPAPVR